MAFRTPTRFTASLALYLLRTLREASGQSLNLDTLLARASDAMRIDTSDDVQWMWRDPYSLASDILADYAQLGVVLIVDGEEPRYLAPPGDGPPDRPAGLVPQGPGDGGSGMAEILAHPILFSVSKEDFDAAVARALERY